MTTEVIEYLIEIARLKTRVQEKHKEIEHMHEVIQSMELNLENALEQRDDLLQDNADLKSALRLIWDNP
jgi:hypothetical protein